MRAAGGRNTPLSSLEPSMLVPCPGSMAGRCQAPALQEKRCWLYRAKPCCNSQTRELPPDYTALRKARGVAGCRMGREVTGSFWQQHVA